MPAKTGPRLGLEAPILAITLLRQSAFGSGSTDGPKVSPKTM
jgi:hypothetical protein